MQLFRIFQIMWGHIISSLNEGDAFIARTQLRLWTLFLFALLSTAGCVYLALIHPEIGSFVPQKYTTFQGQLNLLGTEGPLTLLLRILSDWGFFGLSLGVFIGTLYNFVLGKDSTYFSLGVLFLLIAFASVIPSLVLSRQIHAVESPKTFLVFSWFMLRLYILTSLTVGILAASFRSFFTQVLSVCFSTALLCGYVYYLIYSSTLFFLLFDKNIITRFIFDFPLILDCLLIVLASFFAYKSPSYFSVSLLLCIGMQAALDICTLTEKALILYAGFNGLHALEVFSFLILFIGLTWDQFSYYEQLVEQKRLTERANETKFFFLKTTSADFEQSSEEALHRLEEIQKNAGDTLACALKNSLLQLDKTLQQQLSYAHSLTAISVLETGHMFFDLKAVTLPELLQTSLFVNHVDAQLQNPIEKAVLCDENRLLQVLTNIFVLSTEAEKRELSMREHENMVYLLVKACNSSRDQNQIDIMNTPLLEKQTEDPKLLSMQMVSDISHTILKEMGGTLSIVKENQDVLYELGLLINQEQKQ